MEFQPAQHGFVTFLAAVDSHRLGVHITRRALSASVSGLLASVRRQSPGLMSTLPGPSCCWLVWCAGCHHHRTCILIVSLL